MNLLHVDKKWAKSITNLDDDFQLIPVGWRVKELLTFLREDRQPNHLDLVVIAEPVARVGARDKAENKDKVGNIKKKTYYSRTDTRFPPCSIHSNSGFHKGMKPH